MGMMGRRRRFCCSGQAAGLYNTMMTIIIVATMIVPSCWSMVVLAPETTSSHLQHTQSILDQVFGSENSDEWDQRRVAARASSQDMSLSSLSSPSNNKNSNDNHNDEDMDDSTTIQSSGTSRLLLPQHELVYGELGLKALATLLDAVGVYEGDHFLDIGAGDGYLVAAAALLFPHHFMASRGIEIVPELYERSKRFQKVLLDDVLPSVNDNDSNPTYHPTTTTKATASRNIICPELSFELGNVYEPTQDQKELIFSPTTLAVCFATTWSGDEIGRKLPKLSKALGVGGASELPSKSRLVVIDGVLDHEKDGFDFEGELKFSCPDTAPYSIARLYVKK